MNDAVGSDAEALAAELRLLVNAGLEGSAWNRLSGEIAELAGIARSHASSDRTLRDQVVSLLQEAAVGLEDEIATAAKRLYGWETPDRSLPSKRRRERAMEILYGAYAMSWESFRDRHEQTIHRQMAEAILTLNVPGSRYAEAIRSNAVWLSFFPFLDSIRQAARTVETDLMIRDVTSRWNLGLDDHGEGPEGGPARGLAVAMILDSRVGEFREALRHLPRILPRAEDEEPFYRLIDRWPTRIVYADDAAAHVGQTLVADTGYRWEALRERLMQEDLSPFTERWQRIEESGAYPSSVLRIDDVAAAFNRMLKRNLYRQEARADDRQLQMVGNRCGFA